MRGKVDTHNTLENTQHKGGRLPQCGEDGLKMTLSIHFDIKT